MAELTVFDSMFRLAVGIGCGALIGVERQWRASTAGLRTNALVAAAATLFVLYSVAAGDTGSTTRVASYVVSGIGFLGGGVILRDGGSVRGLNTAATLWCSAAVGILAASGRADLAVLGTGSVVVIHLTLRPAGRLIDRVPQRAAGPEGTRATVHLACDCGKEPDIRRLLLKSLAGSGLTTTGLRVHRENDTTLLLAVVTICGDPAHPLERLIARLSSEPDIRTLRWHLGEAPPGSEREAVA